ncbi:GNAT family protein [Bacillus spongiae]|uniref:GNAT family protein n=1 Tax=Bacillus spongiae TaxID=2683610 RepID=A0ABU8HI28_9BACI
MFCESENLYLRSVQLSDSSTITEWKNDHYMKEMSIGLHTTVTLETQQLDIKKSLEGHHPYYIICKKESNKPIGYIRFNWMDHTERVGWLRFGLGEDRGKGYARQALQACFRTMFETNAHRIDAEVFEFNVVSFSLLKSLGFKHEGTRRKAYYTNGQDYDVLTLGLLKNDFTNRTERL